MQIACISCIVWYHIRSHNVKLLTNMARGVHGGVEVDHGEGRARGRPKAIAGTRRSPARLLPFTDPPALLGVAPPRPCLLLCDSCWAVHMTQLLPCQVKHSCIPVQESLSPKAENQLGGCFKGGQQGCCLSHTRLPCWGPHPLLIMGCCSHPD